MCVLSFLQVQFFSELLFASCQNILPFSVQLIHLSSELCLCKFLLMGFTPFLVVKSFGQSFPLLQILLRTRDQIGEILEDLLRILLDSDVCCSVSLIHNIGLAVCVSLGLEPIQNLTKGVQPGAKSSMEFRCLSDELFCIGWELLK